MLQQHISLIPDPVFVLVTSQEGTVSMMPSTVDLLAIETKNANTACVKNFSLMQLGPSTSSCLSSECTHRYIYIWWGTERVEEACSPGDAMAIAQKVSVQQVSQNQWEDGQDCPWVAKPHA